MRTLLFAFGCLVLVAGGYAIALGSGLAWFVVGFTAVVLGASVAHLEVLAEEGNVAVGFHMPDTITAAHLRHFLDNLVYPSDVTEQTMPVAQASPVGPITGIFLARLNGVSTIFLERGPAHETE